MLNCMKYFVFAYLFILLLPFYAVAKELTALGFVEDPKAYEHDEYYIRLAFIRTDKGRSPSCEFLEGYVLLDSELNVRGISTWNYH